MIDGGQQNESLHALLERLYSRQNFGIKMGLDVESAILSALGDPQNAFAAIHIAGTNGKGSVAAMLDSILRNVEIRTALYTSPHLVRFNERMRVDGVEVTDAELAELFREVEPVVAGVAAHAGREPTFFECTTAMAFKWFKEKKARIAVLETGMGGRLDATNVVTPAVSVITRISMDHTAYLGKDLQSIAFEKAGIVKPGRPVVCGAMDQTALDVVTKIAKERKAPLVRSDQAISIRVISHDDAGWKLAVESPSESYGTLRLSLHGRHQIENLTTAIAALETLSDVLGIEIPLKAVKTGLATVKWPGRFQTIRDNPPTILDGGHNPGAGIALANALEEHFPGKPLALVVGMCADKDAGNFLKPFTKQAKRLWIVPVKTERCMPAASLGAVAKGLGLETVESTLTEAVAQSAAWAREAGGVICICGSLFLVGEVLEGMTCERKSQAD